MPACAPTHAKLLRHRRVRPRACVPMADAVGSLDRLGSALVDAFDPELYGLPWYASIDDRVVRAVRSNQAIGLVDAAVSHLGALGEAARQVRELVGPNGRTIPTPAEVEARSEMERIPVEITDALRAIGSPARGSPEPDAASPASAMPGGAGSGGSSKTRPWASLHRAGRTACPST